MIMKKATRRLIKKAFYNYKELMNKLVVSTVEWAESNFAVDYSKVALVTSPSNHKETQLCGLMDDNLKKCRWCYVVEKVLDHYHFERDKVKFIESFFFNKNTEVETCLKVGCGRATIYRWENEVIEEAYKWAVELKLVQES